MIELKTICKTRRRRPRLAEGKAPLFLRQLLRPRQYGPWRAAGVERRRDRAGHRFPAAPPRQHGDHHLCPRRRDHASGQPRQQGPYRGGRRAGDGGGKRHPSLRIQSGADRTRIFQIWIEPTTEGGEPAWGAKPFPKADRSGTLVTLASGFEDDKEALPIRADARVLGATLKAGESAEYAPQKSRNCISCRPRGRSKSTASASTPATAPQSATKRSSGSPRWRIPNW